MFGLVSWLACSNFELLADRERDNDEDHYALARDAHVEWIALVHVIDVPAD